MRAMIAGGFLLLAGCSSTSVDGSLDGTRYYPRSGSLIGANTLQLTPNISIPLDKVINWGLYAGAAYLILDPLAPNWTIEEAPLADNHVHFSLKMKRYYSGGAGEARSVFHRRAKELALLNGFDGYRVIEYSEAMESSVLGSQRTAEGVVVMTMKKQTAG